MPRLPLDALNPRRIAIIKPSALGDIVHALPVLTALRQRFSGARITWIVNRAYEPLLVGHPDLDETLSFDRGSLRFGVVPTVLGAMRFARMLRDRRFDLAIDLQGLFRSGVMTLATGAPRRVGLSTAREGAGRFYTDVISTPGLKEAHAVDRCWRAAEALGAGRESKRFRLPIAPAAHSWAGALLRPYPRPWLVVAPGARWRTKRWPPEHFAAVARAARSRHGGTLVLIGTDDERPLAARVAQTAAIPALDLSGRTTLPQLTAVLALADLVLANDSGPLHIAAALGRPVVAPYTCTEIRLHGPYACRGAVATGVACRGSYVRSCDHLSCMNDLTPDRLIAPAFEALASWPRLSRSA